LKSDGFIVRKLSILEIQIFGEKKETNNVENAIIKMCNKI